MATTKTTNITSVIPGDGITLTTNELGKNVIAANSSATLIDTIDSIEGNTVQDALGAIANRLTDIDGISDGIVIKALSDGSDPEDANYTELLPNGLYIKLILTSGKALYISAYEIDKAIGIIGDMVAGKADAGDLEALSIELAAKASTAQVALIQADIDSKADKDDVTDLLLTINSKADTNTVKQLSDSIDTKANKSSLDSLGVVVDNKADKSSVKLLSDDLKTKASAVDVEQLKSDVDALENTLKSLSDNTTIVSIKKQIDYLNNEIKKCLSIDDVQHLEDKIAENAESIVDVNERIDFIDNSLAKKANITYVQSQITELNGAITAMSSRVNSKADKKEVALKANQTDLDIVVKKLSDLTLKTEEDINILENACKVVQVELAKKANRDYVTSEVERLDAAIINKADASSVNDSLVALNTKINRVESTTTETTSSIASDVYELECEMNNELSELRATIDMHERNILSNSDNITKLQESDYKYEQSMKNEWVRVLTPEAYNRLAPVGTSYSDGTLDPYAKQANVIYMLVRYNKPIAVYIGEVLIAQAEQKGPQGFAYNFPIIF